MSTLIFKFFRFFQLFLPPLFQVLLLFQIFPFFLPSCRPAERPCKQKKYGKKSPPDKRFPSFLTAFPVLILLKSKGSPYYCIRNGGALFPFQNKKTKPPDFPFTGILAAPFYSKLKFTFTLRFVNRFSNIMAVIFIVKVNPVNSLICIRTCLFQGIAKCCHAEDTASVCHDLAVFELRSCMEAVIALMLFERLESADRESFFVGNRITVRSQYDAEHTHYLQTAGRSGREFRRCRLQIHQ